MIKLISITDITEYKPISINLDVTKKLNFAIEEAQKYDVMPFLGDTLYILLETDFSTGSPQFSNQIYSDLFNGVDYVEAQRTYRHGGIKALIVYYAYARYVSSSNVNHSAFGLVEKTGDHSTGVSKETLSKQTNNATSLAQAEQAKIELFLRYRINDYPTWIYADKYIRNAGSGLKINAIGGNRVKLASSYRCNRCGKYRCSCQYF